ncbi:MAG: formate dehydrogenase accessory sulfurtransferase FdhD [Bacteroidota bacterium]
MSKNNAQFSAGQMRRLVGRVREGKQWEEEDTIVVEEPLEIKVGFGKAGRRQRKAVAVTMRTPGNDLALALGFLFSEGLISSYREVLQIRHVGNQLEEGAQDNVLLVDLHPDVQFDVQRLQRHFYASSSCGVCGKASIDLVQLHTCYLLREAYPQLKHTILYQLTKQLEKEQALFSQTGGIHAAALFDAAGTLLFMQEDVGRHNAVDKLLGMALQQNLVPLRDKVLLLSGRIGFELVQKAVMAGIPIVAAVGAPSSLAIELAATHGQTVIGFLKNNRFNIYTGEERVIFMD